jgi:hypothetical protein
MLIPPLNRSRRVMGWLNRLLAAAVIVAGLMILVGVWDV